MSALAFLLLLAVSEVSGPEEEARARLAADAETALRAGDLDRARGRLRAWASLGGKNEELDPALQPLGAEAAEWSQTVGPLRLFVSVVGKRVRVGVSDPAGVVGRVRARVVSGSSERALVSLEGDPGRWDYRVDPPLAPGEWIVVRALARDELDGLLLRELRIDAPSEPPAAPEPVLSPSSATGRESGPAEASGWPWWFWATAAVAVVATGGAIWQETRF